MFEKIGKKLVQGATAEIQNQPISIVDTDKLIEWGEVAIGIGLIVLGIFCGCRRRNEQPTTIVINNYIQQNHEEDEE